MNAYVGIIIVLASLSSVLAVFVWELRRDLNAAHRALDNALDAAERADYRCSLYDEAMHRPIQAILPPDSARSMAGMILEYLEHEFNGGPMEMPIVPRDKGPKENK